METRTKEPHGNANEHSHEHPYGNADKDSDVPRRMSTATPTKPTLDAVANAMSNAYVDATDKPAQMRGTWVKLMPQWTTLWGYVCPAGPRKQWYRDEGMFRIYITN